MANPPIYIGKPHLKGIHAIEINNDGLVKTVLWSPCDTRDENDNIIGFGFMTTFHQEYFKLDYEEMKKNYTQFKDELLEYFYEPNRMIRMSYGWNIPLSELLSYY